MDLVNQIVRYSYGPNQVEFSAIPYGTFIRSTRHIMKLPTCFGRRDDEASESWMLLRERPVNRMVQFTVVFAC